MAQEIFGDEPIRFPVFPALPCYFICCGSSANPLYTHFISFPIFIQFAKGVLNCLTDVGEEVESGVLEAVRRRYSIS